MNYTASSYRNVISNTTSCKNRTVPTNPYVISNGYSLCLTEFTVIILVMVGGGQNRVWSNVYVVSKCYSAEGVNVDSEIISRVATYAFCDVLSTKYF